MKIVIPGGTGHVGQFLAQRFYNDGHELVVLSRSPQNRPWKTVSWDAQTQDAWSKEIDGADVVINLAGRSVNCRYTEENRRQIMDSRVNSTRAVGEAIANAANPPKVWLQMSTATIYAHRFDAANDEATGIIGGSEPDVPRSWNFSIEVAKNWENAQSAFQTPRTRQVQMRTALVLSPDKNGIFDTLLGLVKKGLGGTAGDGRQYISWMHEDDFARAVEFLIERDDISGPVILASPNPLPNAEFMKILRNAQGVRIGLPAAKWMLTIGAILMHTQTELALKSRRVIPKRLLDAGFSFKFPDWDSAAKNLCDKRRAIN